MGTFDETVVTPFGRKVIRGGLWVFSTRVLERILSFIRAIILARLLSPNDFGLFGIALLMLTMLDTFSQSGFRSALIQKKENIKDDLNTAWTVEVIRSFLIAAALFFLSPLVAVFFETPRAELLLKVIGLSIIFQSFTNISAVYFEKELDFHKYSFYHLAGIISDVTVAIVAAFIYRSVWALILGHLTGNLVRCVVSYLIDPYRPRLHLDISKAKELFKFGKWIWGSSILGFLTVHGDDIFVGKILGATSLGFYQMAYLISNLPVTEFGQLVYRVTFPAYSKIQEDIPRLRDLYLSVIRFTAFLIFPLTGLILILAPEFTRSFLGAKWMPIVPAIQVLAWWGCLRSLSWTNGALLHAVKRPEVLTRLSAIMIVIMVILLFPLTFKMGIVGAGLAVLISSFFSIPRSFFIAVNEILKYRAVLIFKEIYLQIACTVLMGGLLLLFMPESLSRMGVILAGIFGLVFYLIIIYLLDKLLKQGIMKDLNVLAAGMLKKV
ncbi:MAG: lipopolysaccharide biosynthesis protein [Candidatus Omnitrophota bacterium]